jgi:hypothetical protein
MTKPIARDHIYRRRRFDAEIIELCVRWYITYRLSYRDRAAMMAERGIIVSHTKILRWVTRYVPEFEKRWNRFARPVNASWRVDETYINIRGKWNYLYRAVDKHGKTVDFLLRPDRTIAAAQAFFRKALSTILPRWPRVVTLEGRATRLFGNFDRFTVPECTTIQAHAGRALGHVSLLPHLIASSSQTRTHGTVVVTPTIRGTGWRNTPSYLRGVKARLRLGPAVAVVPVRCLLRGALPTFWVIDQGLMSARRRRRVGRISRRLDNHITVLS